MFCTIAQINAFRLSEFVRKDWACTAGTSPSRARGTVSRFVLRADCEFVAFSVEVPNLSPKSFALPFSVFHVSLSSVQLAKQGVTRRRTTTVIAQSGTHVAQLEFALSRHRTE